ncbi:MAG: OprD family porin [Desulfovibrio sp.]|jgi:hypothetical protein|nr:OprD family porin [Desulfovibrio sp.]
MKTFPLPAAKGCLPANARTTSAVRPRRSILVPVVLALLCLPPLFPPRSADAGDDTAPATAGAEEAKKRSFSTGTDFFDKAALSGGLYYFQRDRKRYDPASDAYAVNLEHATLQANADFSSGFLGDSVGVDFALFGSTDIHNAGAVDHEMGFFPWHNPWHPDWSKNKTKDGFSVYTAAIKAKAGPLWGRAGYLQPSGPGVLGVNWSIMPGTYRGLNMGADFGNLSVAAAWADEYKAPWFPSTNAFLKNDGQSRVPWLWSAGTSYRFADGFTVEAAYGESKNHLKNAHFKSRYETEYGQSGTKDTHKLSLGYHLYLMDDNDDSGTSPNDNFAGTASQHYLFSRFDTKLWTVKLEGTYTRAPVTSSVQVGYFAYRLTDRNGSSKGAYEAWWDARSDWNAHDEKAVYLGVERRLDDLLPLPGFSIGLGAALGWDGKAYGYSEHLKEWAFNVDIGYSKPDAPCQGAFVKVHYTEYKNGSSQPSWAAYKNAFQDEHDIKLFMGIPFDL